MVGQEKLKNKLFSYTISTLPKSILLIGEYGCGKHTIIKELAEKLSTEALFIETSTDTDILLDCFNNTINKIYAVNLNNFTEKLQNQFLKIVEEPNIYTNVILFADSDVGILPTIQNRCLRFYFEKYSSDELMTFSKFNNETVYEICKTPGQLSLINDEQLEKMQQLCDTIVTKISKANYANILSLELRFNYGEFYDKFDILLFFSLLKITSFNYYKITKDNKIFQYYKLASDYSRKLNLKALNKEQLVIDFLNKLYQISR